MRLIKKGSDRIVKLNMEIGTEGLYWILKHTKIVSFHGIGILFDVYSQLTQSYDAKTPLLSNLKGEYLRVQLDHTGDRRMR